MGRADLVRSHPILYLKPVSSLRTLAIATLGCSLALTASAGSVLPPAPDPTFNLLVDPNGSLYNWGIGILRPDGGGGYNLTFRAGFADLTGDDTYSGAVTMPVPSGTGDFGYFLLGLYQPENGGREEGVVVGMNPSPASLVVGTSQPWIYSSAVSENAVFNDLADPTTWPTSTTGQNSSFLDALYITSSQSTIAMGASGSPSTLNLWLVNFSEATLGGAAVLTTPVPEASTWAATLVVLGTATFAWQRRRKHQAA